MHWRRVFFGVLGVCLLTVMVAGILLWRTFLPAASDVVDRQIEDVWLPGRDSIPAAHFFAAGGRYIDRPGTDRNIDQTLIAPLLARLRTEAAMTWSVLPEKQDDQFAYALLAPRPARAADRGSMEQIFREADDNFEGSILVLRGNRWVSFEILPAGTPLSE